MAYRNQTPPYTCMETCGQEQHCGNRYCSAHPQHYGAKKPQRNQMKRRSRPKDVYSGGSLPFYFGSEDRENE